MFSRVELVVQFPARGSTQVLLCLFPGELWLWHFLYSVGPHPVSSLHMYTFVVSRAFIAVATSQAGDADSSRAPGLTSALQGSVNVHRGALLLVPPWQSISSFVFYIFVTLVPFAVWSWLYSSPRGVRLKCYYAFFLVCCGCDTSYIVSVHIQCHAFINIFSLCRGHSWRLRLAKQDTLTPPGHLVSPLLCRGPWISTVVLYCWCHLDSPSVLLYFTFLSHLLPLPCGAGYTVPREGFDSSVIMPFSWCVVAVTLPI